MIEVTFGFYCFSFIFNHAHTHSFNHSLHRFCVTNLCHRILFYVWNTWDLHFINIILSHRKHDQPHDAAKGQILFYLITWARNNSSDRHTQKAHTIFSSKHKKKNVDPENEMITSRSHTLGICELDFCFQRAAALIYRTTRTIAGNYTYFT